MSKSIYVLNGPNLNLLGVREPEIYGYTRLDDIKASCEALTTAAGYTLIFLQSNHEGQLIDWIHEARTDAAALIINPAGYGHTSVALLDALKTLTVPIIECHLSNPAAREAFRHHTYVSHVAKGVIAGFGPIGYELAISAVLRLLEQP